MTKKEKLENLVKRKKRSSEIATVCLFFSIIWTISGIFTIIMQKHPTNLTGVFAACAFIGIVLYFIFANIEMKRRYEQGELVLDHIEQTILETGLSEEYFEVEEVFYNNYKVYMQTIQVDYEKLIGKIKQELKWAEAIYDEEIKITLVYFIES